MSIRYRLAALGIAAGFAALAAPAGEAPLPARLSEFILPLSVETLGWAAPAVRVEEREPGLYRVRLSFDLDSPVRQDDWKVTVRPAFAPDFHWSPHLTPTGAFIIDQHAFRSPALVAASKDKVLVLVPDIDLLLRGTAARWYMDLDAPGNALVLGMSESKVEPGLFFSRAPGAAYPAGRHEVGFYLFVSSDAADIRDPWRKPLAFLWEHWGRKLFESGSPLAPDLSPYVRHTYDWAFRSWAKAVWQEFDWNGKHLGAPVFIVNQTQSPNYPGPVNEREFRSIWNQAWFSSLRSASGLFRYARRTGDADLRAKALLTKELALAAPMTDGLFPTVIAAEMETVMVDGKAYNRSKGWQTAYLGELRPESRQPAGRPAADPGRAVRALPCPRHELDGALDAPLVRRAREGRPAPRLCPDLCRSSPPPAGRRRVFSRLARRQDVPSPRGPGPVARDFDVGDASSCGWPPSRAKPATGPPPCGRSTP